MIYLITFLEGIFSFLSPCMLPLLPVYLAYFAGGSEKKGGQLLRICCFILGFSLCFTLLGLSFSAAGSLLSRHHRAVEIVSGALMIFFGLSTMEVIKLGSSRGVGGFGKAGNAFSAFVFGIVYSLNLTPCVGAFLGSALMLVASGGNVLEGMLCMLLYSLGLGIPFLLAGLLTTRLNGAFSWVKRHYRAINAVCGLFLIAVGILTAAGLLNALLSRLT